MLHCLFVHQDLKLIKCWIESRILSDLLGTSKEAMVAPIMAIPHCIQFECRYPLYGKRLDFDQQQQIGCVPGSLFRPVGKVESVWMELCSEHMECLSVRLPRFCIKWSCMRSVLQFILLDTVDFEFYIEFKWSLSRTELWDFCAAFLENLWMFSPWNLCKNSI